MNQQIIWILNSSACYLGIRNKKLQQVWFVRLSNRAHVPQLQLAQALTWSYYLSYLPVGYLRVLSNRATCTSIAKGSITYLSLGAPSSVAAIKSL
jgi:hypothetical protein